MLELRGRFGAGNTTIVCKELDFSTSDVPESHDAIFSTRGQGVLIHECGSQGLPRVHQGTNRAGVAALRVEDRNLRGTQTVGRELS